MLALVAFHADRRQLATWYRVDVTIDSAQVVPARGPAWRPRGWGALLFMRYEHEGETYRGAMVEATWARRGRARAERDVREAVADGTWQMLVDPADARHVSLQPDDAVYYYRDAWEPALIGSVLLVLGLFLRRRSRSRSAAAAGTGGGGAVVALAFLLLSACAAPGVTGSAGAVEARATGEWIREELYFGTEIPGGGLISIAQWEAFVDEMIAPRFPEGLTILSGDGRYRYRDGRIAREHTRVLIVYYRESEWAVRDAALDEIVAIYRERFRQESVLRVRSRVIIE